MIFILSLLWGIMFIAIWFTVIVLSLWVLAKVFDVIFAIQKFGERMGNNENAK